jgi:hypothetical protein
VPDVSAAKAGAAISVVAISAAANFLNMGFSFLFHGAVLGPRRFSNTCLNTGR